MLLISNHNSFRILLDEIVFVYFIWKMYLHFSIGNGQLREPALCQLYRHTFVPCACLCGVSADGHHLYHSGITRNARFITSLLAHYAMDRFIADNADGFFIRYTIIQCKSLTKLRSAIQKKNRFDGKRLGVVTSWVVTRLLPDNVVLSFC